MHEVLLSVFEASEPFVAFRVPFAALEAMMKASIAVAVAAAIVGWLAHGATHAGFVGSASVAGFVASVSFAVAMGAAGFAFWRAFRIVVKILQKLEVCAEKLTYMEHRMDKSEAHLSDVCRHLRQMFEEFAMEKNPAHGDSKWWWCSRQVRDLYAAFASSLMEKGAQMENVETVWKMLQLEVYLRACRDLVAERLQKFECPAEFDAEAEATYAHALQNMAAGCGKVDLWKPMEFNDAEAWNCKSPWEVVLKSQVLERHAELMQFKEASNEEALFEGTGFQYGGSSTGK